jgi:hypothetical protein
LIVPGHFNGLFDQVTLEFFQINAPCRKLKPFLILPRKGGCRKKGKSITRNNPCVPAVYRRTLQGIGQFSDITGPGLI